MVFEDPNFLFMNADDGKYIVLMVNKLTVTTDIFHCDIFATVHAIKAFYTSTINCRKSDDELKCPDAVWASLLLSGFTY